MTNKDEHNQWVTENFGAGKEEIGTIFCDCGERFNYKVLHYVGHTESVFSVTCPYCGKIHKIEPQDYGYRE